MSGRRPDFGQMLGKETPAAIEQEMCLLGAMILDSRVIGDVLQIIENQDGADFYRSEHGAIYRVLVELYDANQPIELPIINQKLRDLGMLEQVGGTQYLIELVESVPSAVSAPYYAQAVLEASLKRRLIEKASDIVHAAYTSGDSAEDLINGAEAEIFKLAERRGGEQASSLNELLEETFARLEASEGKYLTGLDTGFADLNELTSGFQKGEMIIVAGRPSMGKAQPLDAKVLTPDGWRRMGELSVGDALASVDGAPSRVEGIYPQGLRQVYRVTFADGRSTECCAEHLWRVHHREWDAPRVLETRRLIEMLACRRYQRRLWVDCFCGEFGADDDLPLDPWLLGLLIGDGALCGSSVRLASAEQTVLSRVGETIGAEMTISAAGGYDYRLVQCGGARRAGVQGVTSNPIKEALIPLGLWEVHAQTKFIPEAYKTATRESRASLLSGLLDADGWVERWGSLRFSTASERLADDVVELVRSLGGTASHTVKQTRNDHNGESRTGRPAYVCNIQCGDPRLLSLQPEKMQRIEGGRQRARRLTIKSIEPTREARTQCIAVSHPSRLYITDDYIVTHNTAFAVNIAEHIAATNHAPVAIFSLEMSKQQLAQRILCSRSGVDSHKLRRNMLSADDFQKLSLTMGELSNAPLYIDDTPGLDLITLNAKARRLAAQYHVQAVFIDYLQLMSGGASGRQTSREQEVSQLSRGIKALARELDVPVVCLSQLNRGPESREGHRPRMSDLRESGSIEQDADVILLLHREEYYHNDPAWKEENPGKVGVGECIVAKQRNGPTDTVELQFDARSVRFRDLARREMGY